MAKMHFAVRVDGKLRSVYRIRERSNGGLIIVPTTGPHVWTKAEAASPFKEAHYTVHPNDNSASGSTNFHAHAVTQAGEIFNFTTHIHGPREDLLFPIVSANVADLSNNQYPELPEDADYELLGEYASSLNSMSCFMILLHPTINLKKADLPFFHYVDRRFSRFRIGVYSVLRLWPATVGHVGALPTKKLADHEGEPGTGINGYSPLSVGRNFLQMLVLFDRLSDQLLHQIPSTASPTQREELDQLARAAWFPASATRKELLIKDFGDVRSIPPKEARALLQMQIPRELPDAKAD